jgi:hypothetical protein
MRAHALCGCTCYASVMLTSHMCTHVVSCLSYLRACCNQNSRIFSAGEHGGASGRAPVIGRPPQPSVQPLVCPNLSRFYKRHCLLPARFTPHYPDRECLPYWSVLSLCGIPVQAVVALTHVTCGTRKYLSLFLGTGCSAPRQHGCLA